jgi:hypothetical protein
MARLRFRGSAGKVLEPAGKSAFNAELWAHMAVAMITVN